MRLQKAGAIVFCAASFGLWSAPAFAARPNCCVEGVTATGASDALLALQTAVNSKKGCRPSRCDCNGSGTVTVSDAVGILKTAVAKGSGSCPTTPTTTLPPTCGNNETEPGEDCDPPYSFCRGGCNPYTNLCVDLICSETCTCPPPECGDSIIDAGESCDPPGSPCENGTCGADCGCVPD